MQFNPKKLLALAECLRNCFGKDDFSSGDILRRFTSERMKLGKNRQLKAAVQALIPGRLHRERVGQFLNRDLVADGVAWRDADANLQMLARYDATASVWHYRMAVIQTRAEITAEGRALLKACEDDAIERQLAFEAKVEGKPLSRQVDMIERQLNRQERAAFKEQQREERAHASTVLREQDKLTRREDKARAELESLVRAGKESAELEERVRRIKRESDIATRIAAYKAEAERLRTDSDYQRICGELVKARHEPSKHMVATIREIEALRGRPWQAGMSVDPGEYVDYSSARAARAYEPSTLQSPITLRGGGWDPLKF